MLETIENNQIFLSPAWIDFPTANQSVLADSITSGRTAVVKCAIPVNARDMTALLSKTELQHLVDISHLGTANSFVAGRVLIRSVIAMIRNISPANIEINLQESGKPFTRGNLHFNLTHSGNLVLLALSQQSEVGIDVDCIDMVDDPAGMARVAFADNEIREILEADDPRLQFLVHWTRKESIVKCRGSTLACDTHGIYSGFDTRRLPKDVETKSFVLSEKHIGALSCAGHFSDVQWFDFADSFVLPEQSQKSISFSSSAWQV